MGEVVNLDAQRPHLAGEAICLSCKHEWAAVCPIGTTWLECPACHLLRGVMKFPVIRDGLHWTCACGNQLFYISPDGTYCPNCGGWQTGY